MKAFIKALMKILKWFLLLPPALLPLYCFRPNPPSESSSGSQSLLLLVVGLIVWLSPIFLCALVVFFSRNRWTAVELSLGACLVKCLQSCILPLSVLIAIAQPGIYYLLFLPSCIIGLAAVLRCYKEGVLSTSKAFVCGLLQFIVVADLVSTVLVFAAATRNNPGARKNASAVQLLSNRPEEAMAVMREVAGWYRDHGYRVWPDEWLTPEALFTDEAKPENFYLGTVDGKPVCAFIFQWSDREYWPESPKFEAGYLHKLCVRREYAHQGMAARVMEALKKECRRHGAKYLRLDTGYDEPVVRDIYLNVGFRIVKTLEKDGKPVMLLYETEL